MFEGTKYLETKNLPLKEIAKKVKAEILQTHTEIKVSVRSKDYSSIDVEIIEIPKDFQPFKKEPLTQGSPYTTYRTTDTGQQLLDDIENLLDAYNRKDIDSQTDYSNVRFYTYVFFSFEISQASRNSS
ncbi:MAG: hypothetical protein M1490_03265, partial [Candidatus Bathyarchaeota archaeon]|nr:hypothetical protein [Candidatus Bathyarchaeota archaeon]